MILDTEKNNNQKNLCLGKKSGKLSLGGEWTLKNVCFCAFCIWTCSICEMGTNKGMSVALAKNDMAKNDKWLTLSTKASSVNKSSCYTSSTRNPTCNNEQTLPPSQPTTPLIISPDSLPALIWLDELKWAISLSLWALVFSSTKWNNETGWLFLTWWLPLNKLPKTNDLMPTEIKKWRKVCLYKDLLTRNQY